MVRWTSLSSRCGSGGLLRPGQAVRSRFRCHSTISGFPWDPLLPELSPRIRLKRRSCSESSPASFPEHWWHSPFLLSNNLFVSQALHGIELSRFPRRPHSKEQANSNGDGKSGDFRPYRNRCRQRRYEEHDDLTGGYREKYADDSAQERQCHCLAEKLRGDVLATRAHRFADADFGSSFFY